MAHSKNRIHSEYSMANGPRNVFFNLRPTKKRKKKEKQVLTKVFSATFI